MCRLNVKQIQKEELQNDKRDPNVRFLQLDFASCEFQNEIQSALWSRNSVTLFTAAKFSQDNCPTFLICSDTKEMGKKYS